MACISAKFLHEICSVEMDVPFNRILSYIIIRSILFYGFLLTVNRSISGEQIIELRTFQDWFMLLWIFIVPIIIEIVLVGYPFYYVLNKLNTNGKYIYYAMILGLFIVEFILANWVVCFAFPFVKIFIGAALLCLMFHKQLRLYY